MNVYTVQPVTDFTIFTTPPRERIWSPWNVSWSRTLDDLGRELRHLEGHDPVIELAIQSNKIRRDGMPMADAKVTHVGVRMSFDSKHGPLSYTADRYKDGWQANVRAIVLTLDRLRAVDRYGATKGEQYAGFKELPAGSGATPLGGMTKQRARMVIADISEYVIDALTSDDVVRGAFRIARGKAHPDRNDGDRTQWDQVEQAAKVLGLL